MPKLAKRKQEEKLSQTKKTKKQFQADQGSGFDSKRSSADVPVKRKSLQELRKECPPGFRKFELEMGLDSIDEEIALQLWEDVYKPLNTFWYRPAIRVN